MEFSAKHAFILTIAVFIVFFVMCTTGFYRYLSSINILLSLVVHTGISFVLSIIAIAIMNVME